MAQKRLGFKYSLPQYTTSEHIFPITNISWRNAMICSIVLAFGCSHQSELQGVRAYADDEGIFVRCGMRRRPAAGAD